MTYTADERPIRAAVPIGDGPRFAGLSSAGRLELWVGPGTAHRAGSAGTGLLGTNPARTRVAALARDDGVDVLAVFDREYNRLEHPSAVPGWGNAIRVSSLQPVRHVALSNDGKAVAVCGNPAVALRPRPGDEEVGAASGADRRESTSRRSASPPATGSSSSMVAPCAAAAGRSPRSASRSRPPARRSRSPPPSTFTCAPPTAGTSRASRGAAEHRSRASPSTTRGGARPPVSESAVHLLSAAGERVVPACYAGPGTMAFTRDNRFLVVPRARDFVVLHPESAIPRIVGAKIPLGRCLVAPLGPGSKVLVRCQHGFFAVDAARGKVLKGFSQKPTLPLRGCAWILASPDETRVLVPSRNRMTAIFHLLTGEQRLVEHERGPIVGARWADDSGAIELRLGGQEVAHVRVDLTGATKPAEPRFPDGFTDVRNGVLLRWGGGRIRTWSLGPKPLREAVSADGTRAAVLCEAPGRGGTPHLRGAAVISWTRGTAPDHGPG